jgi:hypothetical protein
MRRARAAVVGRGHRAVSPEKSWDDWISCGSPPPDPQEEARLRRVAQLAYSYWEERGFTGGSAEADWFRAEAELRSKK